MSNTTLGDVRFWNKVIRNRGNGRVQVSPQGKQLCRIPVDRVRCSKRPAGWMEARSVETGEWIEISGIQRD